MDIHGTDWSERFGALTREDDEAPFSYDEDEAEEWRRREQNEELTSMDEAAE